MARLQNWVRRHPVLAYVLLCYGITWPVWFCVPLLAGRDWALGKVVTGAGFGPALAAIILDRSRARGGKIGTARWWGAFTVVFLPVLGIYLSGLIGGDALTAKELTAARPTGLSPIGVAASILSAAVAGFIFATLAASRSRSLGSILAWRVPLRWLLVAIFLPSGWMLIGLAITWATHGPIDSVSGGLPATAWASYVLRSVLFTLLVVAIGEEAGWRGWMLPKLQRRFSPLFASLVLGVVWGLWHLPLYVNGQYPDPPIMVLAQAGACVILAILFTWLYNHTGGNLLLAVLFHTALNSTPRMIPPTPWMGAVMLALLVTVVVTGRMWRRRARPDLPETPGGGRRRGV